MVIRKKYLEIEMIQDELVGSLTLRSHSNIL